MMNRSLGDHKTSMLRSELLARASGRILEIGFGSGLNLPNYPESVHEIYAIDCHSFAVVTQSPIMVHFNLMPAETLGFADKTFDTVVSTFTLCSVFNVPKVLQEIKRVLKPAGEFLFLEHGKSWEKGMIAIQNISNPLFRIFGGGCNVNRDLMGDMEKSGLKITSLRRIRCPELRISGFYYMGYATNE
jgi:ubiquinone/menaquinone biosynthesis C-methylase UbiE